MDSLIIIKAQTLLYNNGININTQAFYEYPSIRSLAKFIESKKEVADSESSTEELATISEIKHKNKRTKISYKNILLFGATGFLGIHILHSILQNSSAHIYCIIREKDNLNSISRFYNKFEFYFGKEELEKYKDRITTITGNILKEKFGLSTDSYDELGSLVDCVINSAAIVKHYGNYSDFYNTNVFATKQMVDFCIKYHAHFHYISTMSVSGYGLVECPDRTFTENDFPTGFTMTIAQYGDHEIPVIKDNALKYTLALLTDPETGDSRWFFYDEETDTFSERVEMTADEAMEYANLLSDSGKPDGGEKGMTASDKILFAGLGATVAALAVAVMVLQVKILRRKKPRKAPQIPYSQDQDTLDDASHGSGTDQMGEDDNGETGHEKEEPDTDPARLLPVPCGYLPD